MCRPQRSFGDYSEPLNGFWIPESFLQKKFTTSSIILKLLPMTKTKFNKHYAGKTLKTDNGLKSNK